MEQHIDVLWDPSNTVLLAQLHLLVHKLLLREPIFLHELYEFVIIRLHGRVQSLAV